MGNDQELFTSKNALKLSLIIGEVFFFIMLITYIFAKTNDIGRNFNFTDSFDMNNVAILFVNIILLYILLQFQFWVIKHIKKPRKRVLTMIIGSLLILFVLSPVFSQIQWFLNKRIPQEVLLVIHLSKDLLIFIITLLFTALIYAWDVNQKKTLENQKLVLKSLQNRYEALKNQVDPHFLFNSLNTLNGLVGYDDDKAHEYISQLSSIFRYTMQDKKVLQVRDELNFVQSYIYLMKIRFNESLQVESHINSKYMDYYMLPCALQALVENAIKHNVVSNKSPLSILIETTADETIRIKNSIHLKPGTKGSGIGLSNLDERYNLMFNKEVKISQDEDCFIVEIPLIKDIEKYSKSIYIP